MTRDISSCSRSGRRAFYPALTALAFSCFAGALATDIAYWRTADWFWVDASDWLVTIGVVAGYAALALALIEVFAFRTPLRDPPTLASAVGQIVALILATVNMLVHTRDVWTSAVPWGLVLSALVVFILLVIGLAARAASEPVVVESKT
jgi:uncharacterized membrane protein